MNLPLNWSLVSLDEIAAPEKGAIRRGPFGGSIKKEFFVSDGYKVYEQKNAIESNFEIGHYFIDEEKYKELEGFTVQPYDLIVSCAGTIGKIAIVPNNAKKGIINQALMRIRPNQFIILPCYLKWFLESPKAQREIFGQVAGTALKNLKAIKEIKKSKIPLPPLEEQKRIAKILDKADEIRRKRKESLRLIDELLRSIFLDMFGDPVINPKGWETKTIQSITKNEKNAIKRGPFGGALKKEIFINEGYLVYEQYHALNNDFSFERYYIDEQKFEELKGFEVKPGDIIISCSGVYLGKLAIVPQGAKKGIINQALLKISLDQSKITNNFFTFHFRHQNFRDTFFAANRGSGVPNFPPIKDFKTFPFIVPPIDIQNQFELKIQKIKNYQQHINQSLQESENLFNSLLQRAFRGEL